MFLINVSDLNLDFKSVMNEFNIRLIYLRKPNNSLENS